jgi:hypothetical protein
MFWRDCFKHRPQLVHALFRSAVVESIPKVRWGARVTDIVKGGVFVLPYSVPMCTPTQPILSTTRTITHENHLHGCVLYYAL